MASTQPRRGTFDRPDVRLSYLDYGGSGPVLLVLHGHLNEATFVEPLAPTLQDRYRIIALDQRGHGESGHPDSYVHDRYVDDSAALLDHLELDQVAVLGHSLGGVVAFRLAAQQPERISTMIISDIGAVVSDDIEFITAWPRRTATRDELIAALGDFGPAHAYSMRHYDDGWGLPFEADQLAGSQRELNGDHWSDWCATDHPTLLLRGENSPVLTAEMAAEMVARRPGTTLVELPTGHSVHFDDPSGYAKVIAEFLP